MFLSSIRVTFRVSSTVATYIAANDTLVVWQVDRMARDPAEQGIVGYCGV